MCKICEQLSKGTPETCCWFPAKEDDKPKKNIIKQIRLD